MMLAKFQQMSKDALRSRDSETRRIMGNVLAKYKEIEKSQGFEGWSDEKELQVLADYVKSLKKSLEAVKGSALEASYQIEVDAFADYLPKMLDEAQTRELITPLAEKAKGKMGPFMGIVMKSHQGKVDPKIVRKIAQELGLK